MLFIDIEYNQGVLFCRLDGKLTRKNTYKISNYLAPVILKHRIKHLVYNLSAVSEMDSFGVDALITTKHAMKQVNGNMYLCFVPIKLEKKVKRLRTPILRSEVSLIESLNK